MTYRASARALVAGLALLSLPGLAEAGPTIVVDAASGAVLENSEATRPWYPASLSKLMTAYTVFKAMQAGRIDGGAPIVVSKRAARMAPSKMGYPPGTLVTVDDAMKMLLVQSANDIAVALAEGVSGSVEAFAAEMNANARALGMRQSHWVNPNGLPDPGQVSSARDMAILARAILTEFPQYADLFQIQAIQSGNRVIRTHNALVYRYPGADGMKTGFICASGFNVVATASRGGRRLITVVMGAPSARERTEIATSLFEKNFAASGSGFFGGSVSLASLADSGYPSPPDIRDIACSRKKGGSRQAEAEDTAEVTPPAGPNNEGVMATLLAQQPGAPVKRNGSPLLTSWTIAPPIPVGPYTGPRRPSIIPDGTRLIAQAPPAPAGKPALTQAASYADTAPQPAPDPAAQPEAAPGALPPALGAIRAGTTTETPGTALPGQIPRKAANPLTALQSDPLPAAKPASPAKPASLKPAPVKKPVKAKKAVAKPAVKPAPKPVASKSTDGKPTDTKSADAKSTDAKSTDAKSTDAKPTDTKATEAKATAPAKPTSQKPKKKIETNDPQG
jgi:D-alanyl-D-alanine carboxypeptidase